MKTASQLAYEKYHTPDFSWTVKSNSTEGKTYTVAYYQKNDSWECDCEAYKSCRHIKIIQNSLKGKTWKKQ